MGAGKLGRICRVFGLCRLAGSLILALALGHAAMGLADPAAAVLDLPPVANPPNDPQPGNPPPKDLQPGDLPPGFQPWNDAAPWAWQVLPNGLIYHSYLAGVKEPRIATQWVYDSHSKWTWDTELGGRVGVVRYGNDDDEYPQGWQLDLEGAAFPRLDLEHQEDLTSVDYRFGVPLTYGWGRYQAKFAYYHICAHLGDEFLLKNLRADRINYVRNGFAWGNSYYFTKNLRVYAEASWSFDCDGGAKPWEFQFGVEYSPAPAGLHPRPFLAVNGDIRQEVDFGGNICVETGYQWRSTANHLFRAGLQYFAGKSDQYEFFRQYEEKVGLGLWYDF